MKTNKLFSIALTLAMCLAVSSHQARAQQPVSGPTDGGKPVDAAGEIDVTTLLAHARRSKPRGFSLMAESHNVEEWISAAATNWASMALALSSRTPR